MNYLDNRDSRHKLRRAVLIAALIFILTMAAVLLVLYRQPSHVVFIIVGVAGMAVNAVNWIIFSRKAREQGRRIAGLNLSILAASLASASSIAYGFGETHFAKYAFYIVVACSVATLLLNRRGKTEGKGIEN